MTVNICKSASQGFVKDLPTFKNFSIIAIHYLTLKLPCGVPGSNILKAVKVKRKKTGQRYVR